MSVLLITIVVSCQKSVWFMVSCGYGFRVYCKVVGAYRALRLSLVMGDRAVLCPFLSLGCTRVQVSIASFPVLFCLPFCCIHTSSSPVVP